MARHNGGWHVVRTLHELGVKDVFTLSGGHINPIYDAMLDFDIRLIDTHHEQAAAMAADAYARVRREPGVCLVTAGPGFTNTLTGVAGAFLSNSPLLLISGKSGIEENDRLPLQDIDQQAVATPITKWAQTVYDTRRIPEYVSTAYSRAITGRPGPVYLGMPYEVLYGSCEETMVDRYSTATPEFRSPASSAAAHRALEMLCKSKSPVLIAGSGAWYSGAEASLARFLDLAPLPAFTLNFGRGVVPDSHPCCLGPASPSAPVAFKRVTAEADLIIMLGIRLSLYIGWGRSFNPDAKVVQVDIDPGEIGRNRPADLGIAADVSSVLDQLCEGLDGRGGLVPDHSAWLAHARGWREEEWAGAQRTRSTDTVPAHGMRVVKVVEDVLGDEGMVVVDGGDTQVWADTTYGVERAGHYVKGGPLGCMGVGVPFALGTKAAFPGRQVALITGDGAVGMNMMEFETALRHKLPFVAIVCNDNSWGMTRHQLELAFGGARGTVGVDLPPIAFHEVVRALGGYGEFVTDPAELRPAIERAFASGLPALINIPTDPGPISPATHALTQMMLPSDWEDE